MGFDIRAWKMSRVFWGIPYSAYIGDSKGILLNVGAEMPRIRYWAL